MDVTGVVALETKDGSYNTKSFAAFVERLPRNRTVLLDNVSFHKSKSVRSVANERNIKLVFIPPYSPWFNPIELAFGQAKSLYRKMRKDELETTCFDNVMPVILFCFSSIRNFPGIFEHSRSFRESLRAS